MHQLKSLLSRVVFVSNRKVVRRSHRGSCNRLRIRIVVLITFQWTSLWTYQWLFMVLMGFLQSLIGFQEWWNLFLWNLQVVLLMLLDYFLKIGYVFLELLLKLLVIVMYDFSQNFGNRCVSVLIHALPWALRTIPRLMGLQNVIIGRLNKYFVVTVVLSRIVGVNI